MWHVWHYYADLPESLQALEEIRDFLYHTLQISTTFVTERKE